MMTLRKVLQCASAAALLAVTAAVPAQAQVRRVASGNQAIGFNVGFFSVKDLDSRSPSADELGRPGADFDVLYADLSQGAFSLDFDPKDFSGVTFGGEWLIGLGDYLEAGIGAGFYQRTVPSLYDQKVRNDGADAATNDRPQHRIRRRSRGGQRAGSDGCGNGCDEHR